MAQELIDMAEIFKNSRQAKKVECLERHITIKDELNIENDTNDSCDITDGDLTEVIATVSEIKRKIKIRNNDGKKAKVN